MARVVLVLAVLALLIAVVHGGGGAATARTGPARILVAMPWNNYSHMQVVYPVVRALCARGHEVVLLSRVPMPPPLPANFKFVQLDFNSPAQQISAPFRDAYNILALGLDHCQLLLGQEPVQRLLQGGPGGAPAERFDLVITELFFTDCYVALAHRLGAPHLFVNSGPLPPWGYARFGVPSNPAHVAAFSLPVTDDMPFAARLQNAALWAANAALYHLWFAPREQAVVDALVPAGTPPLARLLPDAAMLLLNTHPALSPARPLPPNVVEVGGLHIAPEQALPQ
ncbi:UDP-glycosyltransferase-18, partial [Frankliniella occidentalis]